MIYGTVAIVGRPNVGKSTLFNRLTHSQTSLVDDQAGVTRDRIYGTAYYDHKEKQDGFTLIDTGGFETEDFKFQPFEENLVWQQSQQAILEADIVLLLLDGKHGLHQHDELLVRFLEQQQKQVLFLVNKIDGKEQETQMWEFYKLGPQALYPCSAAHSKGIDAILEAIRTSLEGLSTASRQHDLHLGTKIALIGRPNAGKSSILNRLLGQERSLVSPHAGTTRDSIDTAVVYHQKPYILIDTAGIRRRTKVKDKLEVQCVIRSLRAIERADIVLLVIDALEGITDQDARLINLAMERYKPLLIIVNKWDLVPNKHTNTARDYARNIKELYLRDLAFIPVHFISCLHNQRVHKIWEKVEELVQQSSHKAPTSQVNESLARMVAAHTPHLIRKYAKRVKFYYATQVKSQPPTLVIKCNVAEDLQDSYKRYMLKAFRRDLGFEQVPVRLILRSKKDDKRSQAAADLDTDASAQRA